MRVRNLKLNLKKIQDYIGLKTDFWVNTTTTNCYAYALGLDIPETNIVEGAYRLGTLGAIKEKIPREKLRDYSYEDKLIKDLKALKLFFEEANPNEIIKDTDKFSYFLISLFQRNNDFHFLRKSKLDNTWWHKRGWQLDPSNKDDLEQVIINPTTAHFVNYNYVNTYKIGFKRT